MQILIIRLSSIGDIILATPLIRILKNKYKNAIIDFIINKPFKEIVEYNPYIDNIIIYDKSKSIKDNLKIKKNLQNNYKIIDLHNNLRTIMFRKVLGKYVKIDKNRIQKLKLVYLKQVPKAKICIPMLYINTAKKLFDIEYDNKGLELWLPEEKENKIYLPNKQKPFILNKIALAPGAKHFTKRWLYHYFVELIIKLNKEYSNIEFNLIGGIDDKIICNEILSEIKTKNSNININDFSGEESLITTTRIINNCNLMITNDTGVMHIAAARKVPIVALFGSTTTSLGFTPFEVPYIVCEDENLKCRPCTHIGRKNCPKKHFKCMNNLTPDKVFNKIKEFVNTLY